MNFEPAVQPISTEIHMPDGVFIKTMVIQKAGTFVPQHAHTYDHISVLVKGRIRVTVDGEFLGIFEAPDSLLIKARTKHLFEALEDGTTILCVHDIGLAEEVSIHEEHQIGGPV